MGAGNRVSAAASRRTGRAAAGAPAALGCRPACRCPVRTNTPPCPPDCSSRRSQSGRQRPRGWWASPKRGWCSPKPPPRARANSASTSKPKPPPTSPPRADNAGARRLSSASSTATRGAWSTRTVRPSWSSCETSTRPNCGTPTARQSAPSTTARSPRQYALKLIGQEVILEGEAKLKDGRRLVYAWTGNHASMHNAVMARAGLVKHQAISTSGERYIGPGPLSEFLRKEVKGAAETRRGRPHRVGKLAAAGAGAARRARHRGQGNHHRRHRRRYLPSALRGRDRPTRSACATSTRPN